MRRRIIAILACHNRRDITLACLAALAQQVLPKGYGLSVVLVDDGSGDGTAAAVMAQYPATEIITADGTLYWAGAMRLAEQRALECSADFLLWLNDDVALLPTALATLLEASDATRGAIAVGCLVDPDSGVASYGGQRVISSWHPLRLQLVVANGKPQPCDTFQGNCVLVPAATARRLGSLDPIFHGVQGMADTDYGFRARRTGIPLLATAEVVGSCRLNRASPPWHQPQLCRRSRLRSIFGPRGMPPAAWLTFAFRHGGVLWPLIWLIPQLRAIHAALTTAGAPSERPRIALLEGIAAIYRLPFYQGLAERQDMVFHLYDGLAWQGRTADQATVPLPLPGSRGTNLYWPDQSGRIAWSSGAWAALRSNADAIVVGQHIHDGAIWLLWLRRRLFKRPRLLAMGHFRLDGRGLMARLRRLFVRGIDGALCYTSAGCDACLRHGVPAEHVTELSNTLDTAGLLAMASDRSSRRTELRQHLDLAEGEAVFLFVGRLYAAKRVDLAVQAISQLSARGYACRLVVAGDGPMRDAVIGRPHVTWLGRLYDDRVLADWFAVAEALLLPDAVGLAAVHAMANEVPVISLANGHAHGPEFGYLEQGRTALLANDLTGLVDSMQRLIETPELRRDMARACRRTAESLPVTGMVERFCAGIRQCL